METLSTLAEKDEEGNFRNSCLGLGGFFCTIATYNMVFFAPVTIGFAVWGMLLSESGFSSDVTNEKYETCDLLDLTKYVQTMAIFGIVEVSLYVSLFLNEVVTGCCTAVTLFLPPKGLFAVFPGGAQCFLRVLCFFFLFVSTFIYTVYTISGFGKFDQCVLPDDAAGEDTRLLSRYTPFVILSFIVALLNLVVFGLGLFSTILLCCVCCCFIVCGGMVVLVIGGLVKDQMG